MTRRKDPLPEDTLTVSADPIPESPVDQTPPVAEPTPDLAIPETAAAEPQPLPASTQSRRSSMLASLLGGAIAAIGGFALSHFNLLGLVAEDNSAAFAASLAQSEQAQSVALAGVQDEIAVLATRLAALEVAPRPVSPDLTRLDDLERRLGLIEAMPSDGTASATAIAAKLAQLEQQVAALPDVGTDPGLKGALDTALARLDQAETEALAQSAEAEATVAKAARDAALRALDAAVASGQPFGELLTAVGDPALNKALGSLAETGVPTLADLQADFPDAARSALQTAREISTEDGWGDRLVDFLAAQTGARSLTPQTGMAPDAILSRAEFALSEGGVEKALAEIHTLEAAVQVPFEDWIASATTYLGAQAALNLARGE